MDVLESLYKLSLSKGESILFEDEVIGAISYKDFETASGKLYNFLLSFNFPKERIAVIRVKRSYRTFIAIAGALKAAVPYVVIGDTSPKEYCDRVYEECEPIITIDDDILNKALEYEYLQGYKPRNNHDLAFIIYSTGSGGIFKGSMQEYGTIKRLYDAEINYCLTFPSYASSIENSSLLFLAGFYSAESIETLVVAMVYKLRFIIIAIENADNIDYLMKKARENNIRSMAVSPKTLPEFLNHTDLGIKAYYVAYETFSCKYTPDYLIFNYYGMSESCGILCEKLIEKDYDIAPAGTPSFEQDVKILNKNNQQTHINEIGEMAFVPKYFRGYIKRMDLFHAAYHHGYFHTGDLGFYNDNHDIVIIGRKIDIKETKDGYIVPLFITNAIKKTFSDITKCYVKIFDDEIPYMVVAYYISEQEHTIEEINNKISTSIPHYSLPTHAIKLEKFEYFFSGKINRNRFEKPRA